MKRPFHLHPAFIFYRRLFFCSRGKHATYPDAYFCIFCGKRMREWDAYIITINHKTYEVEGCNFRHAVFAAIEQNKLHVKLGDTFEGFKKKMLAFNETYKFSLSSKDIDFIKLKENNSDI